MPKFKNKPRTIQAEQFWPDKEPLPFRDAGACCFDGEDWSVTTIHGQAAKIVAGDWVIAEPDGKHFYPCKPDIFKATYEPVSE